MCTEISKEQLLRQLDDLDREVSNYFSFDLEKAKSQYKLVRDGTKIRVVDLLQEKEEAISKWRTSRKIGHAAAVARFQRIWDLLQNNPELDLCVVTDDLKNSRIFQIHKLGAVLENVSLSTLEVAALLEENERFSQMLVSMNITTEDFNSFLKWQTQLSGDNTVIFEQLPKVYWNNHKYKWRGNSYNLCTPAKRLGTFAAYCKFYNKLGICTNANCKFVHDPRNVTVCKDFLATGTCKYGESCRLKHSTGNEYVTPHCAQFSSGKCPFRAGAPDSQSQSPDFAHDSHCKYIHSQTMNPNYPICRQFAHMGFCYRGLQCIFPHFLECPDLKYTSRCLLSHCKYPHPTYDTDSRCGTPVKLIDIPAEQYLLPPLLDGERNATTGSWYGLRSKQQSVDIKTNEHRERLSDIPASLQLVPDSSTEDSSSSSDNQVSGSSEASGDELDADFIKI